MVVSTNDGLEISFLMQAHEDAQSLAYVVCSRGQQVVDATAVAQFDSAQKALAYIALMKTRPLHTGLRRSLISSLKGCPWLTNREIGFEIKRDGVHWAVRVASARAADFLAVFAEEADAIELVSLLRSAHSFRLWTPVGGQASA